VTVIAISILSLLAYIIQLNSLDASPPSVEIIAEKAVNFEEGIVTAEGHVQIHHKGICVYCDHAEYKLDTQDILLSGNVRIYSPGSLTIGQRVLYNARSKHVHISEFSTAHYPVLLHARSACMLPHMLCAKHAFFTTDDQLEPGYHAEAKAVHIYKNKNARMMFFCPTFYVGRMPIFWIPYLSIGPDDTGFKVRPGYDSSYGAFALATYSFSYEGLGNSSRLGTIRVDYRALHGMAFGFDTTLRATESEYGRWHFVSYWTHGKPIARKRTPALAKSNRYRLSYSQHIFFSENAYASCDLNALSDCDVMQDFYPAESQTNPRPDNNISLTRCGQNYTINLLNRFQINHFQSTVRRLPELAWDVKQHPIFGGPFYLEGTWTLGRLERSFWQKLQSRAGSEQLLKKGNSHLVAKPEGYSVFRLGSFAKIAMPKTYFGWITLVPYVGLHATLYRRLSDFFYRLPSMETDSQQIRATLTDERGIFRRKGTITPNAQRDNTAVRKSTFWEKEDNFRGLVSSSRRNSFHPGVNYGLESSFKISRVYRLQSQLLGLDDLMHIMQPYVNYSVVQNFRKRPSLTYQFDTVQQTTQQIPINFPDFQAIDAIDSWNIFRTGVRNNFITRRNSRNYRWLTVDTCFDYNLRNPYFQARLGNLSNLFAYYPSRWFTIGCDVRAPLDRKGFTQFDLNFSLMPAQNFQCAVGYHYLNSRPTRHLSGIYKPSSSNMSQIAFDVYLRLNDNWAISSQGQCDINRRLLSRQRYFIHRDLSSWIASLGMDIRKNQGQKPQTGITLIMTLKAAPQVVIPIGWDPFRGQLEPVRSF